MSLLPKLPPLLALRAFHALAQTGSIRAAGEALGVSHTAVSRHVRHLEDALQAKLVHPAGRGLALTETGAEFYAEIREPLRAIADAALRAAREGRSLTLRCPPAFANRRVLPRLPELQALLPNHTVVLEPRLSRRHCAVPEVDVEVVYKPLQNGTTALRCEKLCRPRVFPVLSPPLLARQPEHRLGLEQLAVLPMLHDETTQQWSEWLAAAGSHMKPHGACLGTAQLALEAAAMGQGVAIANALLVQDDLRAGRLVEAFPSEVYLKSYFLLAAAERWEAPEILVVRQWLATICQQAETGA